MLLMIDNYDSFTYNLVQYLGELGVEVKVVRNDEISVGDIDAIAPDHIVISPGPCTPNEAGISVETIRSYGGRIPILGVCLGHQSIGQAFGGKIVHARQVMHGKTSPILHGGAGVFSGLENPFEATRYHSLVIEQASLPDCLEITAWTEVDGGMDEIMGVRHKELAIQGVQFHPESILTRHGHDLLHNFVEGR
ncbi:MAG: anthranilate/aminodeoxychorismate synthase component II [gamma proteobacterium symbiont of Ctena orbiculata]|uniref:Aminodeoxychorismate/anthranilate synthase component II n=1 Tax=Candidatus Thiodiazotropha taylori TaxID=2792791 RepID=A0A944M3S9_9GAMM|nr:aminodeoxychorismate/anthranilate synthase component II [Candidatus Thiodiazotropha taylori]PUB89041.1 MAG: anthranilate/aminodeoxychorismate synthase component II [gamma proteobacterium symbiont of Ctena orbiculata]MBT2987491.1 aminodeoxychorismate/anthranilate synthase component II [Candidatus Thiodiazotropha taylori]MBT2995253.1 aminodeoxychorismate/anthranilate synthase component II [Candidatus Thiodiazotropha taylori]MBT2999828.1 aminodeoxychorismate/anthranilate synthase component II [